MRIGMMTDMYRPHVSGVTNYIDLNKTYMEAAGHQVFVFTFGEAGHSNNEANVIRSPGLPLQDTGVYLNIRYTRAARLQLQTMDLVHVHHPLLSGQLALRYCHPLRIPVVFTNHTRYDLYAQAYLPILPEEISTTLLETYMPNFCTAVDLVISPSRGMANILRQFGVTAPIEVIPNGVDLQRFNLPTEDRRSEYGYAPDDLLMVYSGRLAPEKNLEFLLKSFAGVAEAIPGIRLLLVGGGPQEDALRQQVSRMGLDSRIHFTGMIPYDNVPHFLSMCDIFITASLSEVHPLSVIEAMASGLPVLGIRSVGVGDTVEDGVTGFLAGNDPAAFAAKMTVLCLDKALRKKMGTEARNASGKYAIESTTKLMLAQYERLVYSNGRKKRGVRYWLRSMVEKFRQ